MLNREEYNVAFKTNLSQKEFDDIMGKPITDLSEVEELSIADRKGNVWRFLPKANAIPIEYIEKFKKKVRHIAPAKEVIDWLLENWEKENEK